ncbi:MAG: prolipoprotein diacylglyceryl transferase [Candidatus Peribacter sp.]|jgi:phosphatidylglycerol---prolipoprotein diacylglyceryl transferase|nr:prolipoprotein diacylglyceryl transferase [Candidatus Peribacter sp.]MBT4393523.1 prolipoprotein diacylglyceryl transferase [Candidatus Peribacter sp.]MBT4601260.1 prolipoprotein diacylglyceryl transferase [Candidatus Peribacter sp.]MBT5149309.1 prolipoprotein diacylglyceryl transferase [Candidatus Peribacter sp.]MBT5638264.1 prolipoprotein diacylglyceryl transferase [Candidatus Peribacter sp.]
MQFLPTRQVAVEVLGFSVHWYGLLYLAAFLLAYHLVLRLQHLRSLELDKDAVSSLLSWAIGGVIVGGRMGYVLFYEYAYFSQNTLEVLAVWNGGMSSHGGFIGVAVALGIALKKRGVPVLAFLDVITVPIALGLACGRLGNFINWELYGTVSDLPWAMVIPGVEGLRHPTFFYALIKNLLIAAICYRHLRLSYPRPGETFSIFLLLYGILRFFVEYFREQPYGWFEVGVISLSRGQLLTLPLILIGVISFLMVGRRQNS